MNKKSAKFTREELYEKIWSTPATKLAEEFGISGRGLGKMCARFDIPVPPRGYWAKLAVGKPPLKTPLPPAKPDAPDEISIEPSPAEGEEKIPEAVRAEVEKVLEERDLIGSPKLFRALIQSWPGGSIRSANAACKTNFREAATPSLEWIQPIGVGSESSVRFLSR